MQKQCTLMFYHVPQDNDDPEVPNAFGININADQITLKDIRQNFPLEGEYIFRFKQEVQKQNVWLDLNSDSAKPPLYKGRIMVKATRLNWNKRDDGVKDKKKPIQQSSQSANNLSPKNYQAPGWSQFAQQSQIPSDFQHQKQEQQQQQKQPSPARVENNNLLDF